eukprot:TRINITY_DN21429_c0_g1_i2.p5 TRINITY_DN21429_c0_g1~~TRINITY_DN21429_c0_g1_i2.p5  ORF type:complete len:128 (-),score=35.51 TRINITY_DN21429_c0_g1_i2:882-1265(-)
MASIAALWLSNCHLSLSCVVFGAMKAMQLVKNMEATKAMKAREMKVMKAGEMKAMKAGETKVMKATTQADNPQRQWLETWINVNSKGIQEVLIEVWVETTHTTKGKKPEMEIYHKVFLVKGQAAERR